MAGTSLLALIDDIATLLDDIAVLSKTAATKTAGVLGDDLALNAEQVSGVRADRELPVVWAVAKGSAINKLMLVPGALVLSAFAPFVIGPLLMAGGAYLCFEGAEKVVHSLHGPDKNHREQHGAVRTLAEGKDLVTYEQEKIKGAIRTDLVLSAEIVIIALGTVQEASILTQALVLSVIASTLTVGVYAVVAAIVKLDDIGLYLTKKTSEGGENLQTRVGRALLWFSPQLLKTLSILGTGAMFLVGGGIWVHGISPLSTWVHGAEHLVSTLPQAAHILGSVLAGAMNFVTGLLVGGLALGLVQLGKRMRPARNA